MGEVRELANVSDVERRTVIMWALSPSNAWKFEKFVDMLEWVTEHMTTDNRPTELKDMATALVIKTRECYRDRDRWERYSRCTKILCPLTTCHLGYETGMSSNPRAVNNNGRFNTRTEVMQHVTEDHPRVVCLAAEVARPEAVILPVVRRGLW